MELATMDLTAAQTLVELFANVDVFMAVFVRVMGFFIILPITSGQSLPLQGRIVLAVSIALLAFVSGAVQLPAYEFSIVGFMMFMVTEFLVGLVIGMIVMIIFSIFQFVGQLTDFSIGFRIVDVMDPFSMQQMPVTGQLYFFTASIFFLTSGAFHMVLRAFFDSFSIIGLGQGQVIGNANLAGRVIDMMISYFHLGLRMALPIVGTLLTIDIVLGILVKAIPNMNVFVVGMPLKVMVGLVIIYFIMPFIITAFGIVMDDIMNNVIEVIWRMAPNETYSP
ncbi:MAG: flagellar biosynthetic protein FliR [Defluviitaleaceae bacterium]|nr:flagellar biosynthetic protein FliR [Defluviitaleaceae bacterium]